MAFWHYIVIGCIIQGIICMERQIRLPEVRQMTKENLTNPWFWVFLPVGLMFTVITWPLSIYCEIRLIQNGL